MQAEITENHEKIQRNGVAKKRTDALLVTKDDLSRSITGILHEG